jgi:hypothetical protein
MTDMQQLALESAALKALADTILARQKEVRAEMQAALTETGVGRVDAKLPGGVKVGTISRSDPKPAAVVTDAGAFLAWVRETAKDEVTSRVVTEVRPAYAAALLAEMTAAGTPTWCDRETGEVHDVPGVEVRATRAASHSVRLAAGGADLIAEAWRSGLLGHLAALPQIAAGPEDTATADSAPEGDALRKRVAELEERDAWLSALEAAGVDNWGGIEVAISMRNGDGAE